MTTLARSPVWIVAALLAVIVAGVAVVQLGGDQTSQSGGFEAQTLTQLEPSPDETPDSAFAPTSTVVVAAVDDLYDGSAAGEPFSPSSVGTVAPTATAATSEASTPTTSPAVTATSGETARSTAGETATTASTIDTATGSSTSTVATATTPAPTSPASTAVTLTRPTSTTAGPVGGGGFPANVSFDYQIGSAYEPPSGVGIVSRDWHSGQPLGGGAYSICYVNAFQTQPDGSGSRIDEESQWPAEVVLTSLGDDPNWEGEFLIDLSSGPKRSVAADHVAKMVDSCASKGFDAVEFDNLDSWTRIPGLPFGRADAIAFASLITDHAQRKGLAVAQKNTVGLSSAEARDTIGFDFAIVESCGQYNECDVVASVYGANAVYIEYSDQAFRQACAVVGGQSSVVRRNRNVSAPGSGGYVYDEC